MPKLTKLSIAVTAFVLAATPAALAQDDTPDMTQDTQVADTFTSADIDADGALDRDEFISFVVMKSDAGDADYSSIKLSGEYDNHFNTKDYNADGLLTKEELKAPAKEHSEDSEMPEMEAPLDEPG